jgi:hypothetical protein
MSSHMPPRPPPPAGGTPSSPRAGTPVRSLLAPAFDAVAASSETQQALPLLPPPYSVACVLQRHVSRLVGFRPRLFTLDDGVMTCYKARARAGARAAQRRREGGLVSACVAPPRVTFSRVCAPRLARRHRCLATTPRRACRRCCTRRATAPGSCAPAGRRRWLTKCTGALLCVAVVKRVARCRRAACRRSRAARCGRPPLHTALPVASSRTHAKHAASAEPPPRCAPPRGVCLPAVSPHAAASPSPRPTLPRTLAAHATPPAARPPTVKRALRLEARARRHLPAHTRARALSQKQTSAVLTPHRL